MPENLGGIDCSNLRFGEEERMDLYIHMSYYRYIGPKFSDLCSAGLHDHEFFINKVSLLVKVA